MDDNLRNAVLGAADGNTADFGIVYSSTYAKTYTLALKYSGTEKDALDIVQDAYVCVWANIRMLNKPEELFDWIENITVLTAKNHGFKTEAFPVNAGSISIDREVYNNIFSNAIKGIPSSKSKRGVTEPEEEQPVRSVFDRSVIPSDEAEQSAFKGDAREYCDRFDSSHNADAAVLFDDDEDDDDDEPAGMSNVTKIVIAAVVIVVLIVACIVAAKLLGKDDDNTTTDSTEGFSINIPTTSPTTKDFSYISEPDTETPTEEPSETESSTTATTRSTTTTRRHTTTTTTTRHTTTEPTTASTTQTTEQTSKDITNATEPKPTEPTTEKPTETTTYLDPNNSTPYEEASPD